METATALRMLLDGCTDLGYGRARRAFEGVLSSEVGSSVAAGFLIALQMRGETAAELLAGIHAVRSRQVVIDADLQGANARAVDIGGSGGDSVQTFNVSTTAALVAAAAGACVYKHGGRAVSGLCGSLDVLEQLRLPVATNEATARDSISRYRIAFLSSSSFLRYPPLVHDIRRELGVRTAFNLIGPWCNPARVQRQVVGVSDERYVPTFTDIALALGLDAAVIVHGRDGGLDEFSPAGVTVVTEVRGKATRTYEVRPCDFNLARAPVDSVSGGGPEANARHTVDILEGSDRGPRRGLVLLTAGAALYTAEVVATIGDGATLAAETIDSGRAAVLLRNLQSAP